VINGPFFLVVTDEKTAAHVPPSSMAALAVAFQSWLVVDSAFTSQTAEVFASTGMSHPSEFLRITVGALLVSGRMSLNYVSLILLCLIFAA
jgi:hypothetical protein